MSALRKAGVWLGLVEDEDEDDLYEEPEPGRGAGVRDRSGRADRRGRDLADGDGFAEEDEPAGSRRGRDEPFVPRSRGTGRRADDPVRSITREPSVSYLSRDGRGREGRGRDAPDRDGTGRDTATRDNLALAPEPDPEPTTDPEPEPDRRYQITTLHPTTYREARTIGEHFREGTPVIMNLTEMDEADARRLVDFGAGLAFGLRGTMERVTNRVFLLSPADVQVTPEDKAKIAGGGHFRQR